MIGPSRPDETTGDLMEKQTPTRKTRPRRKAPRLSRAMLWILIPGAGALLAWGVSRISNIVYTDADLPMVDFFSLSPAAKHDALVAANRARCHCGCGMTQAQCVVTDIACPERRAHIDRIRLMVEEARASKS